MALFLPIPVPIPIPQKIPIFTDTDSNTDTVFFSPTDTDTPKNTDIYRYRSPISNCNSISQRIGYSSSRFFTQQISPRLYQRYCKILVSVLLSWSNSSCRHKPKKNLSSCRYSGVPRGSILEPWLFIQYNRDMKSLSGSIICVQYADDTTSYTSTSPQDGRLQAGEQLVSVDGRSLVGISQEHAAEYMKRTGPTVVLEVARQGAFYHGLATVLEQPSPRPPLQASAAPTPPLQTSAAPRPSLPGE